MENSVVNKIKGLIIPLYYVLKILAYAEIIRWEFLIFLLLYFLYGFDF